MSNYSPYLDGENIELSDAFGIAHRVCINDVLALFDNHNESPKIVLKDGTSIYLYRQHFDKINLIFDDFNNKRDHAKKHDAEKLRYDLLPPESLEQLVAVLTYGAKKYGDRNWEQGLKYSRVFAAVQRHLWAWYSGEDTDAESGINHLAHAMCGIAFLIAYTKREMVHYDDRRPHNDPATN